MVIHSNVFSFLRLWANNGDALSRQYAGTNALKGDFTRTGERNLSGLMKDGVNSASRYSGDPKYKSVLITEWLNYWHILISKDMSGFTSNTLLIRIQYHQFKYFTRFNKSYEKNGLFE